MALPLKLTPDQVDRLANLISEKRTEAEGIVRGIYTSYQDVVGSSWMGGAASAALGKQDEFMGVWSRLGRILDDLQSGVIGSKNLLTAQDDDDRSKINQISADAGGSGMNFARL
ncbi:WXG100 family type VII secretion target [Amycolatopsis rhizosphaerae]|nr:WXG100 family type VII secretion target [Amycolatopsis rhizosphaerae]